MFRGFPPSLCPFTSFTQRRAPWQFDHPPVRSFPSFIHGILERQGQKGPQRLSGSVVFKPECIFQRKSPVEVLQRNHIKEQIRKYGGLGGWGWCPESYLLTAPQCGPVLCTPRVQLVESCVQIPCPKEPVASSHYLRVDQCGNSLSPSQSQGPGL